MGKLELKSKMSGHQSKLCSSDTALIKMIMQGDRDQYRHLVMRYKDQVFAIISRQVSDRNIAEELTQETFVKAYLNLSRFRGEASFATWISRIAINHASSYFSSRRQAERQITESLDPDKHQVESEDQSSQHESKQLIELFQTALEDLKPKLREVVVLCSLEGKSYQEAAEILQVPVGTVRSRLNKARLLLKEAMPDD